MPPQSQTLLMYNATDKAPGGVMGFDAVLSSTLDTSTTVTEYPVESGANVSDHARMNASKVMLEVFVTNTPMTDIDPLTQKTRGAVNSVVLDIPKAPGPKNLYTLLAAGVSAIFGGSPEPTKALVLTFDNAFLATQDTLSLLTQLQREARLIQVVTRDWYQENLVIESISAPRNPEDGGAARISITLKEVRIVETEIAQIPLEPRLKKPVAAAVDSKEKKSSVLAKVFGSGGGVF